MFEQTAFNHKIKDPLRNVMEIKDPMLNSAGWVGDWDEKWNGWRQPKLEGGHRAVMDCIAAIACMQKMATSNIEYAEQLIKKYLENEK